MSLLDNKLICDGDKFIEGNDDLFILSLLRMNIGILYLIPFSLIYQMNYKCIHIQVFLEDDAKS